MTEVAARSCSVASAAVGEGMPGSAPVADAWLAIEQLGPYGRDALLDSRFPADIGRALTDRLEGTGIKPVLIRPVGRHADDHLPDRPRRVLVARSRPGAAELGTATIATAADLLDFDFAALLAGGVTAVHPSVAELRQPVLLVCSHARRDVCCARFGRPVAAALAADPRFAGRIWESSHLGGHRFAPTALQLPHGWVHGRLSVATAAAVLSGADSGTLEIATARGRSALAAPAQAADLFARGLAGATGLDDTQVSGTGPQTYFVEFDGTARRAPMTVSVTGRELSGQRPESCGKIPSAALSYDCRLV